MASGAHGLEPTLLIKTTTLELKYLLRLKRFGLFFVRVGDSVAYGIQIDDDPDHPAYIWSFLEAADEIVTLKTLSANPTCAIFLFNELAVNVAEQSVELILPAQAEQFFTDVVLHSPDDVASEKLLGGALDALHEGGLPADQVLRLGPYEVVEWNAIVSHYITNSATASPILPFETDEGDQQEQLAIWLIDNLHPQGAVKNPQITKARIARELCDVLLTYSSGMFLVESKTLSIFSRGKLPAREKLERDISKHINKAVGQLAGAVRNAKNGYRVYDQMDNTIEVDLTQPPHVIVLVPDLTLLHRATVFDGRFFKEASAKVGGFFHILDPVELLRTVQVAHDVAERSEALTPIMAWDWYLLERSKLAGSQRTPNFHVLFRSERDPRIESQMIVEASLPK